MSKYYNINGMKVRVSDHEPNFSMDRLRGRNDVEFYTVSADNRKLSVIDQIDHYCDKHDLDHALFAEVAKDISMATGRDENTPELAPSSPVKRSRLLRKGQLERKQSRIIKNETFSQFFYKNLLTELKK